MNKEKILILNGSPRKKGNTSILAEHLVDFLPKDQTLENIHLYDINIKPCIDCRACKKGDLVCTLNDGMTELYGQIDESNILIIGTPIYWFGPTAQIKLLLDRFRPYYVNKKLKGKKLALILPAGSGVGDCDLTIEMFKRSSEALGLEYIGAVTSESYDAGDALKDITALKEIENLAARIV